MSKIEILIKNNHILSFYRRSQVNILTKTNFRQKFQFSSKSKFITIIDIKNRNFGQKSKFC